MNKLFFLILISIFCFIGDANSQTVTEASTTTLGLELYNARKYKESIVEFNKSIKADPKDGKAFYYRGLAKMHESQNGFCKDLEESVTLGYSTSADIYYYGCDTHKK